MYQNVNIIVYIWSPNLAMCVIAKIGGCTRLTILAQTSHVNPDHRPVWRSVIQKCLARSTIPFYTRQHITYILSAYPIFVWFPIENSSAVFYSAVMSDASPPCQLFVNPASQQTPHWAPSCNHYAMRAAQWSSSSGTSSSRSPYQWSIHLWSVCGCVGFSAIAEPPHLPCWDKKAESSTYTLTFIKICLYQSPRYLQSPEILGPKLTHSSSIYYLIILNVYILLIHWNDQFSPLAKWGRGNQPHFVHKFYSYKM